jgi:cysteine desulfurase
MIYLDNNSTTRIDPAVLEEMMPFLTERYGNPSSAHSFGGDVRAAIDLAHERVASLLGCQPDEIIFTSCGTESNNAALHSAMEMNGARRHIVTTSVEHNAVLKYCEELGKSGCGLTVVAVDETGQLNLAELEEAIRPETAIVSVMWANNETGVLFPVEEIAEICRARRVLLHTDAVQTVGKVPIDLAAVPIQYLSLSGHKLHAPKGVGALYANRRARFRPLLVGGTQENGRRAGTDNVASVVALGKAAEISAAHLEDENTRVRGWRDRFEEVLTGRLPGVSVNGAGQPRLPNTSNLSFEGIEAEALMISLDQQNLYCSLGSSCATGSIAPSHVLRAMHMSEARARGSLRFSFGRFNTDAEL